MPYRSGINWVLVLAAAASLPACAVAIPQDVKDGYRLPDTLEMCQQMLIDANDSNYLLRLEVKQAIEANK